MPEKIAVALLTNSTGAHVGAYLSALAGCPECESVCLSDPDGTFVEDAKKTLGDKLTRIEKDHGVALQASKPAMALVTMEALRSPAVIEAALDAGCHVFAEKPACVKADDFAALKRKADGKHRHLMLAFANRLNPPVLEAQTLIRTGKLGRLYGLEMHLVADQTRLKSPAYHQKWFAIKERAGGGNLAWLGIHYIDLAMHLTGSRIEQVTGFAGNVGGQPLDVEDSSALAMKFDNGVFGTFTSGYYLDAGYQSHLRIWGSHGWLEMIPSGGKPATLEWYSTKDEPKPQVQKYTGPTEPSGYGAFVRAAIRASAGLQEPPITAEEGLRTLQAVFGLYEAARTGRTQTIG